MFLKIKITCVKAEHSTYLTAFNSLANFSPCSNVTGFCLFFANFSIVAASSLKSICVPTSKNGVFWQWCVISGTHCLIEKINQISTILTDWTESNDTYLNKNLKTDAKILI